MKFRFIALSCVLVIIAIIIGGIIMKMFAVGNVMDVNRISMIRVDVEKDQIKVEGRFLQDSALAFKGYDYRIDNDNIYIKVYSTVVSPIHKYGIVDITINGDFLNIKNIYFEDSAHKLQIWSK